MEWKFMGISKIKVCFIIFFISVLILGCDSNRYSNNIKISSALYSKDSVIIMTKIRDEIVKKEGGFYAPKYSSETFVHIDTIIYSPDSSRLISFIVNNAFFENKETLEGKAYLGIRNNDTLNVVFYGYNLNGFSPSDSEKIKKYQYQYFFNDFSKIEEEGYEYNVNDIRFWTNFKFWDKIEKNMESRADFEEMKKENPKDIYEPKNRN